MSPQPYHQLASVLRSLGRAETADAVLYAGKEHERHAARWRTPKWWGMSLLKWTIGCGYGYQSSPTHPLRWWGMKPARGCLMGSMIGAFDLGGT
jgi:hypothetical protein